MKSIGVFSKSQVLRLQSALAAIQLKGSEGFDHEIVIPGDVVDTLLRCG